MIVIKYIERLLTLTTSPILYKITNLLILVGRKVYNQTNISSCYQFLQISLKKRHLTIDLKNIVSNNTQTRG